MRPLHNVFHSDYNSITFLPTVYKGSFFSISWTTVVICCPFSNSHSHKCEVISHCGFKLPFSWWLVGHLYVSFGKMSIKVLCTQSESEGVGNDISCKWKQQESKYINPHIRKNRLERKVYNKKQRKALHNGKGINIRRGYKTHKYICT